jgi:hypothetical protein
MSFPWVSREMHDAVLAERERVIVALRAQIAMLEKRLLDPIPVTVTLPKDFAVIQPAVVQSPTRKKKKKDRGEDSLTAAASHVDLASLDENDTHTLMVIAVGKNGRRAANEFEMRQWVRTLKVEIQAAKAAKRRRESLEQDEPAEKQIELQAGDDLDAPVDDAHIPAHIREQIEAAERGDE